MLASQVAGGGLDTHDLHAESLLELDEVTPVARADVEHCDGSDPTPSSAASSNSISGPRGREALVEQHGRERLLVELLDLVVVGRVDVPAPGDRWTDSAPWCDPPSRPLLRCLDLHPAVLNRLLDALQARWPRR